MEILFNPLKGIGIMERNNRIKVSLKTKWFNRNANIIQNVTDKMFNGLHSKDERVRRLALNVLLNLIETDLYLFNISHRKPVFISVYQLKRLNSSAKMIETISTI